MAIIFSIATVGPLGITWRGQQRTITCSRHLGPFRA